MNTETSLPDPQLGRLIKEFRTSAWNYWWLILISFCILLILLIFVGAMNRSPRPADDSEYVVLLSVFIPLAALPIVAMIYQLKNTARFYENAVVYENRRYKRTAEWTEIRDVWEWCARVDAEGVPLPSQLFYALRTSDGSTMRFSPRLNDIEKLGQYLKSEAVRRGIPIRPGVPPAKVNLKKLLGKPQ
jgi:hypothetical protein